LRDKRYWDILALPNELTYTRPGLRKSEPEGWLAGKALGLATKDSIRFTVISTSSCESKRRATVKKAELFVQ